MRASTSRPSSAAGSPATALYVLPETIDFELFDPERTEPLAVQGTRGFTFLTNFDFTDRKGWDVLLDAWYDAFGPDDDVCLVLKCLGLHVPEPEIRARIDADLAGRPIAPILFDTRFLPAADMPRLYAGADAFVLASRGEGWGRPWMEAMAMGLPTIGSRWSGTTMFMDDATRGSSTARSSTSPSSAQSHTTVLPRHTAGFTLTGRRWPPRSSRFAGAGRRSRRGRRPGRTGLIERFGPEPIASGWRS